MNNKEKQIEEMARDLKDLASIVRDVLVDRTDIGYIPDLAFPIAKEVLKHYQPKLPKDSVVLSKTELEQIVKAKIKCINDMAIITRKKTAEKYSEMVTKFILELFKNARISGSQRDLLLKRNKKLAKQFGVETKE